MKLAFSIAILCTNLGGMHTLAALPVDYSFTYQGRLSQDSEPANGSFDLRFRLFDAVTNGGQIGPDLIAADQYVEDGLFTAQLNFGDAAFTGAGRWVEIGISTGNGQFTTLSPRQPITAVPFAICALNHSHWTGTGTALTNANTGSFVGVNTTTPVAGREYFGVHSLASSGYGGMYMATDGGAAKPFYGMTTGAVSAWTYLNGQNGDWRIYNEGDRVCVTDDGRVGVGIDAPSATLQAHVAAGDATTALGAYQYGSGFAANLESHQNNAEPAVSIYKNGGTALETTGDVEIGGKLYTGPLNDLLLGSPVAIGCFDSWIAAPDIQSGTGNFTVEFDGDWGGFLITVDDESDPTTWVIQASITSENPEVYGSKVAVRIGRPDPTGTFRVSATCYADCDIDCCPYGTSRWNFVVLRP